MWGQQCVPLGRARIQRSSALKELCVGASLLPPSACQIGGAFFLFHFSLLYRILLSKSLQKKKSFMWEPFAMVECGGAAV
jgi:hypothetical protein